MDKIKKWIFDRDFVKAYLEVSYNLFEENRKRQIYQDAFKHAREDLKETNIEDIDTKAKELSDKRLKEMLSLVDYNYVVSIDKKHGFLYLGKEKADVITLNNLKAEAEFLSNSLIWKLLCETPKELAQESMFKSSESLDDLKKGKAMLYHLDSQNNIINTLKGYTPKAG